MQLRVEQWEQRLLSGLPVPHIPSSPATLSLSGSPLHCADRPHPPLLTSWRPPFCLCPSVLVCTRWRACSCHHATALLIPSLLAILRMPGGPAHPFGQSVAWLSLAQLPVSAPLKLWFGGYWCDTFLPTVSAVTRNGQFPTGILKLGRPHTIHNLWFSVSNLLLSSSFQSLDSKK